MHKRSCQVLDPSGFHGADGSNAWLTKWPSCPCGCHCLTSYAVCSPGVQLLWRAPQEGSSIGELKTKLVGPWIFLLFTAGPGAFSSWTDRHRLSNYSSLGLSLHCHAGLPRKKCHANVDGAWLACCADAWSRGHLQSTQEQKRVQIPSISHV